MRYFDCHEKPQLCRGFVAAVNLRGEPKNEDDKRWCFVAGHAADILGRCIDAAAQAQRDSAGSDDRFDSSMTLRD